MTGIAVERRLGYAPKFSGPRDGETNRSIGATFGCDFGAIIRGQNETGRRLNPDPGCDGHAVLCARRKGFVVDLSGRKREWRGLKRRFVAQGCREPRFGKLRIALGAVFDLPHRHLPSRAVIVLTKAFGAICIILALANGASASARDKPPVAAVYSAEGGMTSSGETYSPAKLTAAHRTLPFGTMVRVTSTRNGRTVVVRINDRGPFTKGFIIDVSQAAARELHFSGLTPVTLEVVAPDH